MVWRYLLATVLSVLVLILFQTARGRKAPPAARPAPRREVVVPREGGGAAEPPAEPVGASPIAASTELRLSWSEGAAALASLRVRSDRGGDSPERPFLRAAGGAAGGGTLALTVASPSIGEGGILRSWSRVTAGGEGESGSAPEGVWTHEIEVADLHVTRRVRIARRGGPPRLEVAFEFENTGSAPVELEYELSGPTGRVGPDTAAKGSVRAVRAVRGEDGRVAVEGAPVSELPAEGWSVGSGVAWVGVTDFELLGALFPARPAGEGAGGLVSGRVEGSSGSNGARVATRLRTARRSIAAGAKIADSYTLYAGPRDPASLAAYSRLALEEANRVRVRVSPRFELLVDTGDGSVPGFYLPRYDEEVGEDPPRPYRLLFEPRAGRGSLALEVWDRQGEEVRGLGFDRRPWTLRIEPVEGDSEARELLLERSSGGVRVVKRIGPAPAGDVLTNDASVRERVLADPAGSHHLKISIEVTNRSGAERSLYYRLGGPAAIGTEHFRAPGHDIAFGYGTFVGRGRVETPSPLDAGNLPDGRWERTEQLAWIGISNSYFAAILFPRPGGEAVGKADFIDNGYAEVLPDPERVAKLAREKGLRAERLSPEQASELEGKAFKNVRTGYTSALLTLGPDASARHEYGLFAGPREKDTFEIYSDLSFEGINYYGWFSPLVRLFIFLLETLKSVALGSWGVGIVLLTLLVKLCLHPINRRSQHSMMRFQKKMQKIKPQMDELKKRFGDDRLAMNRETQKLWKEHGINPAQQMAGCLMIFLQLPIWIGLYTTLQYAIGLRQAPFLWIEDLTRPDGLLELGFRVPLTGWTELNLLPILYVILTLVNQRMQPRPDDPQMRTQYRMMSFMMLFFGVLFYSFPAGFMLYIMTSAGLGIIESRIIKGLLKTEETSSAGAAPVAAYPASASRSGSKGKGSGGGSSFPASRRPRRRGKRKR